MTSMIERAARALWVTFPRQMVGTRRSTYDDLSETDKDTWRRMARAAIAAMRGPTEAMRLAGSSYLPIQWNTAFKTVEYVFDDMIDAALAEYERAKG